MEALVGKRIRPLAALSPDLAENDPERSLAATDGTHTLQKVLDSLRRYRRLLISMIVVGPLLAAIVTFLMPPAYLATAQLAVDVRSASGSSTPASPGAEEAIIDTHVTVLLSDAYLRRLLPVLSALDDARKRDQPEQRPWVQGFRSFLGHSWAATKELIFFQKPESSDGAALAALKRSLKAGQERRSRIISVTSTMSDPQRAAEIVNTVAQSYVDEIARQRQGEVEQALNSLSTQASNVQHDLAKAQDELKTFHSAGASPSRDTLEWRTITLAQQLESLVRRRHELIASGMVVQPDISLIATASPPEHPSSLHPLLIVPPAAIVFALLGCVLAVVLVRLDRTLHTQADATEALHIPCAGLVPSIPPELSKQPQYLLGQSTNQFARAIRSILISILTSGPAASRTQRTVFVTSSVAGEGKTTLAWSLALYAARLGRRTLFLDFSQSVRRRADENASLLGLLTRERPLADVVEPIQDLGIDFLPAGISDGNRLRLLAHPKLSPLLRHVCDSYDVVVIDGPSLLEAPEARLLASWADHVLLAVQCGMTNRETAQTALSQLARTEPLNATQNTTFWSVLTRAGSSQHDQFGRPVEAPLRRILGAIRNHRSKPTIPPRVTTDAAIEIRRHPASNLKSR